MNTITIELSMPALRMLSKSIGKTRDSELRKLERPSTAVGIRQQARADLIILDEIDSACQEAIINHLTEGE